jgi:hypothetical protein
MAAQGRHLRRTGGDEAATCTLTSEPDVVPPRAAGWGRDPPVNT